MGVLFISHASQNNDQAIRVRDWLQRQGYGEIFLDLDPARGIAPGHRWQEELKRAGENCAAVIVLISPEWAASVWCQTEFLVADQLGKKIFPILVAATPLDSIRIELRAKFQIADISAPALEADGLHRLAVGLKRAGLAPKSFDWPPPNEPSRAVYRGLQALDVQDAAIFFGRDAAITRGLDELRRIRDGARQRLFVILGASGAGKSSFLRAGLIARLERDDENFLVLPIIRPGNAVISGPEGLLASLAKAAGTPRATPVGAPELLSLFADLRGQVVSRMSRYDETVRDNLLKPPTIIIPIDQAEELFGSENTESGEFLELLTSTVAEDSNVVVVVTIRSDSYELLQTEPRVAPLSQLLFNLQPIAAGSFHEVISGPARLASPPLTIEPELTQALLTDLDAADALPLLAFTLERLLTKYGKAGQLTHHNYANGLGGIGGAVQSAISDALGEIPGAETLALARRLFLPALVSVDQERVKRRVASWRDIPVETRALARRFVDQRLLITDLRTVEGAEIESIEVAHEAILRQWPALQSWISEERDALRTLDAVRLAAREWRSRSSSHRTASDDSWLVHRSHRLSEAERIAARPDFSALIDPVTRDYLSACRAGERKASARQRSLQLLAALSVLAVLGVGATWQNWDTINPHVVRLLNYEAYSRANTPEALAALPAGAVFQDCEPLSTHCPEMIVIPAGELVPANPWSFTFGGRELQERFSVDRFAVSRTEVTFDHWDACVAASGCRAQGVAGDQSWGRGARPVINVTWDDAHDFVTWMSQMTGAEYRLLSNVEWEYAARAVIDGSSAASDWSFGDDRSLAPNYAWFNENSDSQTHPVASRLPNQYGLHDMHGNVWEWVDDCFSYSRPEDQSVAPLEMSACGQRIVRGGSWVTGVQDLRSANIDWRRGEMANSSTGFRVARTLPPAVPDRR